MRIVGPLSLALACLLPCLPSPGRAAALVSAFPQPGIWWNPSQPGTALLWESEGGNEWHAQVLEYDDLGTALWLDMKGQPLRYRDAAQVEPDTAYAVAVGELSRIEGGCVPGGCVPYREPEALRSVPAGAAQIEFADPTHAIWTREGRSTRIEHFQAGEPGFVAAAGETYLLLARRRDTFPTSANALVRAMGNGPGAFHLVCLDCTDAPELAPGRLQHEQVAALAITCAPRCELAVRADPAALLNLPYTDRLRAIARTRDFALSDIAVLPVGPGFSWRFDGGSVPIRLSTSRPGSAGVFRSDGLGSYYTSVSRFHLLLGQGLDGFPRWWSAQYLQGPCTRGDTDRGTCFVLNHGSGRFAEPVQRGESTVADFKYRFVFGAQLPYLLMAQDSFARPPLAPPPWYFYLGSPPWLQPPVVASSGILVVRAPNYELRGHVRARSIATTTSGGTSYVTIFECIDCSQRGIGENTEAAEATFLSAIKAFRSVDSVGLGSYSPLRHEFISATGERFRYSSEVTNRQGDEIIYRRFHPYHEEDDPLPPEPGPDVPESLQYFPLSDG